MLTGLAALTFTGLTVRANDNTVVSNLDEGADVYIIFGYEFGKLYKQATAFTTGGDLYNLKSVTATFEGKTGNPRSFEASLHADNGSGLPGSKILDLSGGAPATTGKHIYACSGSSCDLSANTTYHLVFSADRDINSTGDHIYYWRTTDSNNEDQTPSNNGWSIANNNSYKEDSAAWASGSTDFSGLFSVQAEKIMGLTYLRKTWEMGRGCVIMKGATLELHEQRLSTWLQGF